MGYALSIVLFFVIVVLSIVLDLSNFAFDLSALGYFVDIWALLLVVPTAVVFALAVARRGQGFFSTLGDTGLGVGFVGGLLGLVLVLQALDDPSRIGPGMAISLLSMLYGTTVYMLARTGAARLAFAEGLGDEGLPPSPWQWVLWVYPLLMLLLFTTLLMGLK